MTLIAAFKIKGVPLLMGDFLITGGASSATRKKVHIISPNFVIAWTGHLLAAEVVISDLSSRFSGRRVSRKEVEEYLKVYPAKKKLATLSVRILAWVVDAEPFCFLWNSSDPRKVWPKEYDSDGSGSAYFNKMFEENIQAGSPSQSYLKVILTEMYGRMTLYVGHSSLLRVCFTMKPQEIKIVVRDSGLLTNFCTIMEQSSYT